MLKIRHTVLMFYYKIIRHISQFTEIKYTIDVENCSQLLVLVRHGKEKEMNNYFL